MPNLNGAILKRLSGMASKKVRGTNFKAHLKGQKGDYCGYRYSKMVQW